MSIGLGTHVKLGSAMLATASLLDDINSAAAYSVRKLKSDASQCLRIRRSSDNSELDIGFSGKWIDQNSIKTFGGYNLLKYTQELDNASWNSVRSSTTTGVGTNPLDSSLTAFKLVESTDDGSHALATDVGPDFISGKYYTLSCYAKAAERYKLALSLRSDWFASFGSPVFDLSTGTMQEGTGTISSAITDVGDGWYRCEITALSDATGSSPSDIFIFIRDDDGNNSYQGDGTSGLLITNVQLVIGQSALDYQVRTSAEAGDCFVTKWYDQSGNDNDLTQTVAAQQPKTYDLEDGLILEGNKPAIEFADDFLAFTSSLSSGSEVYTVLSSTDTRAAWLGASTSSNIYIPLAHNPSPSTETSRPSLSGWEKNGTTITPATRQDVQTQYHVGSQVLATLLGADLSNVTKLAQGSSSQWSFDGIFQECLIFSSAPSSEEKTIIRDNINSAFNIY